MVGKEGSQENPRSRGSQATQVMAVMVVVQACPKSRESVESAESLDSPESETLPPMLRDLLRVLLRARGLIGGWSEIGIDGARVQETTLRSLS